MQAIICDRCGKIAFEQKDNIKIVFFFTLSKSNSGEKEINYELCKSCGEHVVQLIKQPPAELYIQKDS